MSTLVDLELKAKEAFVDDNFELAVDLYSQAIELDRKNADLYADRAQANIKLGNFTEAVSDANKAIEFNPSLPKAYLRKGTACLKLEEYQTAKTALEHGVSLAPGDARFINLIKKCDECIQEETRGLQKPIESSVSPSSVSPAAGSQTSDIISSDIICKESAHPMPTPEVISKPRYRHDYYNSPTHVVLTIFVKKIPPENVHIEFGEQILSVSIDIPGEEAYHFQPRLFGKILPEKCKYEVLSTKIEIRLAKAENIVWTSLEFCQERNISQRTSTPAPKSDKLVSPYSKTKVDWNKLEAQVKKEEKDEKLDGDAALNKFFREIYGDADEDTRRAMQKSFVESNGTVLSTNWKEVGAKKIEGTPPDGMELKKWEY